MLLIMTAFVLALGLSSCDAEKYNVKFLVDGELYATVQAVEDEPIKLPKSPEKDGFTFDGWYLDNGAWQDPFNESDACALGNLCVYAKWLCAHTVTEWITDILPTCKDEGAQHKECSNCKQILKTSKIEKLTSHTPAEAVVESFLDSSCMAQGSYSSVVYCLVCECMISNERIVIERKPHTEAADPEVAPTCTKAGLTAGKHCSVCNEIFIAREAVPALGHTARDGEYKAPTCTVDGFTAGLICEVCNDVLEAKEKIPATGHSFSSIATPSTCTERGYTTHTCHCGSSYVDSYVDALGHTALTVDAIAPTCTEAGFTMGRYCSACDTILIQQSVLPATGHTSVTDPAIAPSCTEAGLTAGAHCSVCREILTPQATIPALGHDYSSALTSPTCTERGYTIHTCHCGSSYVDSYVDALGHTALTVDAIAPTCTEAGFTMGRYCSVCDTILIQQSVLPALGHTSVTDPAIAPTCTKAGLTVGAHCSACSEILTPQATIPALGHDYSSELTSPTCTEKGYTTHTCHCGSSYVDSYGDALGHTALTVEATAPTCTEAGLTAGAHCSVCSEILTPQATIPALGHDYSSALTSPTCTEKGYTTHTCHCGSSYVDSYVDALGHTALTVEAIAPTCTEAGLTLGRFCSVCNTVLIQQTALPATGHTSVTDPATAPTCTEAGLTEGAHCSVCNETLAAQITVPASGHTYINHAAKDADCESVGWQAYTTCSECEYTTYVEIPAHGHMVSYTSKVEETITNYITENDADHPFSISGNIITSTNRGSSANNTSATYTIIAKRALTLSLEYKTSCENNYDFLSIKHNGTEKVRASGKSEVYTAITIDMAEGDTVTITYTKDESDGDGSDCVFVKLVTSPTEVRITDQTTLAPATDELISSLLASSDSVACATCGKTLAENPHEESDT